MIETGLLRPNASLEEPLVPDVDLRLLRYFVAVTEEHNFTRAPDLVRSDWWIAGPEISDTSQIPAMVRLGHGIALVPESVGAAFPGVGAVRIVDCPPSTVRIVWETGCTSRAVACLLRHVTSAHAGPHSTVG